MAKRKYYYVVFPANRDAPKILHVSANEKPMVGKQYRKVCVPGSKRNAEYLLRYPTYCDLPREKLTEFATGRLTPESAA